MLLGYERISAGDEGGSFQQDALKAAGCKRTFSDRASGAREDQPALKDALNSARQGDTLVVWRLDRLGRSLPHLIATIQRLEKAGIGLRSLTENIDTTTPNGKLFFHLFDALADFERELARERIRIGLAAARAGGRRGGRPPKLSAEKVQVARRLLQIPQSTVSGVARRLGVHRSTLYKALSGRT